MEFALRPERRTQSEGVGFMGDHEDKALRCQAAGSHRDSQKRHDLIGFFRQNFH